eukprot:scaffold6374_cov113-Isochrysis_galbana.AAC.1
MLKVAGERDARAGGLWTRRGARARVTMAVSDTHRGGAAAGPPKGPPYASQPMLRVAGGVGATLGWEVCGPGGERACVTMTVSDTRRRGRAEGPLGGVTLRPLQGLSITGSRWSADMWFPEGDFAPWGPVTGERRVDAARTTGGRTPRARPEGGRRNGGAAPAIAGDGHTGAPGIPWPGAGCSSRMRQSTPPCGADPGRSVACAFGVNHHCARATSNGDIIQKKTCNSDASAVVPPPHTTWYRPTCGGKGWSARHAAGLEVCGVGGARACHNGGFPIRTDVEECVANSPRRPHRRPSSQGRATGSNATGCKSYAPRPRVVQVQASAQMRRLANPLGTCANKAHPPRCPHTATHWSSGRRRVALVVAHGVHDELFPQLVPGDAFDVRGATMARSQARSIAARRRPIVSLLREKYRASSNHMYKWTSVRTAALRALSAALSSLLSLILWAQGVLRVCSWRACSTRCFSSKGSYLELPSHLRP